MPGSYTVASCKKHIFYMMYGHSKNKSLQELLFYKKEPPPKKSQTVPFTGCFLFSRRAKQNPPNMSLDSAVYGMFVLQRTAKAIFQWPVVRRTCVRRVSVIRKAQISSRVWKFLRFTRENEGKTRKNPGFRGLSFLLSYFLHSLLLYYPAVHGVHM